MEQHDGCTMDRQLGFFLTLDKEFLYHRVNSKCHRHLKRQHTHKSYHQECLDLDNLPTHNISRASVKLSADNLVVTSFSNKVATTSMIDTATHSFGPIKLVKPKIDWFMHSISSSSNTTNLWNDILQGQAYAVSDGSLFPASKAGACACIVSTKDGLEWIKGGGIIQGHTYDQDPYRSELGGQVGLASIITAIILPTGASPNITVACDGEAAIDRVNMEKSTIKYNMINVDMLSIISDLWETSSFTIIKQHVYGHQDESDRQLTQLERLICRVDLWAKEKAQQQIAGLLHNLTFTPTNQGYGTITCNGRLITSKVKSTLYKQVTMRKFITALGKNKDIPKYFSCLNINWWSFGKAHRESTDNIQTFITKWLSGDTATGRVMVTRQARLLSRCPRCDHNDEHLVHVLTCGADSTLELRENLLTNLILWMESIHTSPAIVNFVQLGLSTWFINQHHKWSDNSHIFTQDEHEDKALQSQLKVGWFFLLSGMIASDMIDLQQKYYTRIESQRLGSR